MNPKKLNITMIILLTLLILYGCGPEQLFGPTLTPTTTPSFTPSFTSTSTKTLTPTTTYTASKTNTPTNTEIKITNTPISQWFNIPIIKGAYNIEVSSSSVEFDIKETVINVFNYYNRAMKNLGYSVFATGEGGKEILTFYFKGNVMIAIAIKPDPSDESISKVKIIRTIT